MPSVATIELLNCVLEILERLNSRISYLRSASLSRNDRTVSSIAEIQLLVDAIVAGDAATASYLAELHVGNAARAAFLQEGDSSKSDATE